MKRISFFLLFNLLFFTLFAQEKTVSGSITDEMADPLPGVTVFVEGTTNGTISDVDGNYSINVPVSGTILSFSFIGYDNQEIEVGTASVIDVEMLSAAIGLNEVVAVGYGTQSKKDLTGAVSVVRGDDIVSRSTSNVSEALQGAISGVSVTRSNSAPGATSTIRVRGITTLQGESSPLILVDDVPVDDINDVNSNEIESISVLKDAASAAIYGSRAAAGVIIITTKKAKEGTFNIDYNGEFGINRPTEIRDNVSAVRYMEMYNEAAWNDNDNMDGGEYSVYAEDLIADYPNLHVQDPNTYPDTDWRSLILKKQSETQRHNISLTAGSSKMKTNANFSYEDQNALYDNREWKRYTGRINNDLRITDKVGATMNMAFKTTDNERPPSDPTYTAISAAPIYSAIWDDGRMADGKDGGNPYAVFKEGGTQTTNTSLFYGKFGLDYSPIDGLKLSFNLAPNYEFIKDKRFDKSVQYYDADDVLMENPHYVSGRNDVDRSLTESRIVTRSLTSQALANYNNTFGAHTVGGVLGYEEYFKETEGLRIQGTEFLSNDYPFMNQAPVDKVFDNGSSISDVAYRSVFGRASYNYMQKYYVQGTVRGDASSRFDSDYRWGYFPSIGLGWVLSEEGFMNDLSWLDFSKLRFSYGSLGNDRLGNYLYSSTLQFSDVLIANGATVESVRSAAQTYLAVTDITWETTTTIDLGIDLTVLDQRLTLSADWYSKETTDMLMSQNIPSLSGYLDPTVNVGDMTTVGWEFSTGWRDNIGDFNYSVSANVYDSKSTVGYVADKRLFSSSDRLLSEEGIEFRSWYGYESDGIYQTQEDVDNSAVTSSVVTRGDVKYKDQLTVDTDGDGVADEADGVINEEDKVVLGGSLPRFQYGGNINLEYKGIDFGLTFQGVGKHLYYVNPYYYAEAFADGWRSPPELLDGNYWSMYNTEKENANALYPRISNDSRTNNKAFSDYWLQDGSYFRIKNLTLGYTIPKDITERINVSKLRVYVSGNDLFTIHNLPKGIDPEQGASSYLITKSFLMGVRVTL